MRPYGAILWDSFYQAYVSWPLWIVLGAIFLFLAVLGGFTYRHELNTELRFEEVNDWRALAERLTSEQKQSGPTPGKHIVALLPGKVKLTVENLGRPTDGENGRDAYFLARTLADEISGLLADDSFYDAASFARVRVSDEARDLIARSDLSSGEIARRNRLLFEGAYPDLVRPSPREGVQFYYLYLFQASTPVPLRTEQLVETVTTVVTSILLNCLSFAGIMVAIVLTSWQIPFMFEEGSINLLLSKPISRSFFFLAKYLGGCAFILITSSVFVLGMYLIVGVQFGIWIPSLLWSIPVFLFVFATYYAVSAVAALLTRNPTLGTVLSIAGVFAFWGLCFGLGATKAVMEVLILHPYRLVKTVADGERMFAVNETGAIMNWNDTAANWDDILVNTEANSRRPPLMNQMQQSVHGPVFKPDSQQLIALPESNSQFPFLVAEPTFVVGHEDQNFRYEEGAAAPSGVLGLFLDREGRVLVVTRRGVLHLERPLADPAQRRSGWLGMLLPRGKSPTQPLGPEGLALRDSASVALNYASGDIVTYSDGTLTLLRRTAAGKYELGSEHKLEGDPLPGLVASCGDSIVVALSDGSLNTFSLSLLTPRSRWEPEEKNRPRFLTAAPGGRHIVVLYHSGRAWCVDGEADELELPNVRGQGDISSVDFSASGELFVTDRNTRVAAYDPETWKRSRDFAPPLTLTESIYFRGVLPAYRVLPKPGELNETATYLITKKRSVSAGGRPDDLAAAEVKYDPWAPILPGAVFILVVLAYGCWRIERMEF